jgi:UDP-N-acetylmuramoyl-L-alanyl-D-glutamate--2,6-diaminopimelate ligase
MTWNLHKLLVAADVHPPPGVDTITVSSLCYDSRKAAPGSLFFALPGSKTTGAEFASDATRRGAVAVVAESDIPNCAAPVARVPNARAAMADVAATFHGHPSLDLKMVGVTGTNGKTTATFLVKHLCDQALLRCGLIGTVRYTIGDREVEAARTTPESVDIQALLAEMRSEACRSVAMEVSSHALFQYRARGIEWDAAVFTNLTQDHLDYHGTMDRYFDAKAALFDELFRQTKKRGKAVVNADDRYGHRLVARLPKQAKPITYGFSVGSGFRANGVHFDASGTQFQLETKQRQYLVRTPLIGTFNVYNTLAALAAVSVLGLDLRAAVAAIAQGPQVPGRLERVPCRRSFQVFVDYAHTDDALTNVLRTLRELRPRRIIAVFGCGGDRDRAKRPLMASAAESLADFLVITSDNPRKEDPNRILDDIVNGLRGSNYEIVPDRERAIFRAVELADTGDIVLIAGKGHEKYQEFADAKVPFDDVAVAKWAINEKPVAL